MRWLTADAREADPIKSHSVCRPKEGTHVVETAYVVEDHSDR